MTCEKRAEVRKRLCLTPVSVTPNKALATIGLVQNHSAFTWPRLIRRVHNLIALTRISRISMMTIWEERQPTRVVTGL